MYTIQFNGLILSQIYDFVNLKYNLLIIKKEKDSYSTLQFISLIPLLFKYSFVFENGLLPKKPVLAENGEGWGDSII